MIATGTRARAEHRRRIIAVADTTFHKGEWMECGEDPVLSPTVFLAEQPPGYQLGAHFHRQNQFQLFVAGSGSLGPHPIEPVTVHYAGAYTGYGPLQAGAQGLKYFTIRPVFDTGFIPASDAREKMIRGPKRHAQVALGAPWSQEQLARLECIEDRFAIAPDRGLAVQHMRLPPGAAWNFAPVSGSSGAFLFVLAGALQAGGAALGLWESLFATPDEALRVTADGSGAELVLMHVPPTPSEYAPRGKQAVDP